MSDEIMILIKLYFIVTFLCYIIMEAEIFDPGVFSMRLLSLSSIQSHGDVLELSVLSSL